MPAASSSVSLVVMRHTDADEYQVDIGVIDERLDIGIGARDVERSRRLLGGFCTRRADCDKAELGESLQCRDLGTRAPSVVHVRADDADTD